MNKKITKITITKPQWREFFTTFIIAIILSAITFLFRGDIFGNGTSPEHSFCGLIALISGVASFLLLVCSLNFLFKGKKYSIKAMEIR